MGIADKLSAPDEWHRRRLRPGRRDAKQHDELAPFHSFNHLVGASTEVRVLTARTLLRSWHTKILGIYLMFFVTSLTNRILLTSS